MTFSSAESKVWYDIETKKPIFVDPYTSNHTQDVLKNPTKYRLPANYFESKESTYKYDYDTYVLVSAMKKNFVRIAIDYRNPDTNTNLEAIGLGQILPAALWYKENVTRLTRLVVVVRTGIGDKDGRSYALNTPKMLEFFFKYGRILQE